MFTKAVNWARAWAPAGLVILFVATGTGSAWLLGLKWISIVTSLLILSLLVLVAHVWGQAESALSRAAEDSEPVA